MNQVLKTSAAGAEGSFASKRQQHHHRTNKRLQFGMEGFSSLSSSTSSDWENVSKHPVSELLNQISVELIPSPEHSKRCQELTLQILSIFEKEMMSDKIIGHGMVAGSYGKGTAITNESDYDIVIFFSKTTPPFTKILNSMETYIKDNASKFKGFKWRFRSSIHLCFDIEGIRFDVTPAAQMDHNGYFDRWCCFTPCRISPFPSMQYTTTLKKISEMPDPEKLSYLYSSSLSIDAVVHVQRHAYNPYIHAIVRVAKLWAKKVNTGRIHIRGKSLLIETVAIQACTDVLPYDILDTFMERAFIKFLDYFANLQKIRICNFECYEKGDVPDKIFNQTPLVLDPLNPYNNLLSPTNFPAFALKFFQDAAQITLKRVNTWKDQRSHDLSYFKKYIFTFV